MSPVPIPQTPRAKTRFGDDDDEAETPVHRHSSVGRELSTEEVTSKVGQQLLAPPEAFPRYSTSSVSDAGRLSPAPQTSAGFRGRVGIRERIRLFWADQWKRNKGVFLVAISQFFGSLMNLAARLLEHDEGGRMNPFQILFARQGMTAILCIIYMYVKGVQDFPLGDRSVRSLLVARGLTGFFGIYGLWYSLQYLPLAEATVITFLAPSVAGYICHILIHEPFTRTEQTASFISVFGVALIAQPSTLFGSSNTEASVGDAAGSSSPTAALDMVAAAASNATAAAAAALTDSEDAVTSSERLSAIGMALIGVLGAAGAFTTIRWIGKRAHPLVSVNYFSVWCVIVSTTVLGLAPVVGVGQPDLRFELPHGLRQWALLLFLGTCGFVMQFLLTSGLGKERSNRATMAIYSHMLFAAAFDRLFFGHIMSWLTLAGCGLIIGSAIWVALTKNDETPSAGEEDTADERPVVRQGREMDVEEAASAGHEEVVPMLANMGEESTGDDVQLDHLRSVR